MNEEKNYFITVNYGTSYLINQWVDSIKSVTSCYEIIVVDNFKDKEERNKTKALCKELNITLIESENIGYGRGLNLGIKYCFDNNENNFKIFAGNLDVLYLAFNNNLPIGKYIYIPIVEESKRKNRNPFLTKLQKNIIPMYYFAGYFNSLKLLKLSIIVNKLFSYFPSEIWTLHGSLFCFHSSCIKKNEPLFNEKSFLYCEEMEFGAYMENEEATFIETSIHIKHIGQASTSAVNSGAKDFFALWWPSFQNWYKRWK